MRKKLDLQFHYVYTSTCQLPCEETKFTTNEPDLLHLRNGTESDQNFHYQILALDLGGQYQNENSQMNF